MSKLSSWEGNPTVKSSDTAFSLVVWEDWRDYATKQMDIYGAVVWHAKIWLPEVLK